MPDEGLDRNETSQGTRSFVHAAQQKMICNLDMILVGDVSHQLFNLFQGYLHWTKRLHLTCGLPKVNVP